jgi:hypothetical protein
MKITLLFLLSMLVITFSMASDDLNVSYKTSKAIDFESLLIEGQNKRADLSVVTGNLGEKDSSLIEVRKDFQDQFRLNSGESLQ